VQIGQLDPIATAALVEFDVGGVHYVRPVAMRVRSRQIIYLACPILTASMRGADLRVACAGPSSCWTVDASLQAWPFPLTLALRASLDLCPMSTKDRGSDETR
jgi:hypothetical protein